MFCPKCGTKALEDAEFCQKCGAKLIVDTFAEQTAAAHAEPSQVTAPGKRKSKLLVIIGVIAAVVAVIAIIALNGSSKNDYEAYDEKLADIPDVDPFVNNADAALRENIPAPGQPNDTSAIANQLFLREIPIENIMGASPNDIIAAFGEPETQTGFSLEYGVDEWEGFTEDGWMCFYLDDTNQVNMLNADPVHFTFDGQSLVQDFDTLVTILGDDYTDMGGTVHSWQVFWNYRDYQIYFTFPMDSDDGKPHSIDVMKSDSETPADDDDYSWVEGDIEGQDPIIDSSLNGRWRSDTGSYMELRNGNVSSINFRVWQVLDKNPDGITWATDNGRLTFLSRFDSTYEYKITYGKMYSWDKDRDWLQFTQDGRRVVEPLERIEGDIGDGLIGKWSIANSTYDFNTVVIYADGTGSMGGKDMTWYSDDTSFSYTYYQTSSYDYYVSGDILTLYSSSGSTKYTRVGD